MMPINLLTRELNLLINKEVIVEFKDGGRLKGVLKAIDPTTLNIVLSDIEVGREKYRVIVYRGENIKAIYLKERYIDLTELRKRLERVFPRVVEYRPSEKALIVMNKIKVTEDGVFGEPGPIYNRVKRIYDEYIAEIKG
ncbi:small nuclear ribonucleoprotein (Sm) [Candidatus Geothermarchaeota archaeon]|nr:MAG: small nuclear ribonucleoprotein (Sm) [Candidatus Geothermarchaeota archaeon]RLG62923.1 MAG: small nuclear ribonucleoprotein (Sm) [Candidatus Geothermarchaeota archaeon]HEW93618.1 small nuclear ribonucleoprotein (Sm) [Thermoprotei archaeon]